jgi:hypothetical protein
MFTLGYWAMGNRGIFYNIVDYRAQTNIPANPVHGYFPQGADHTTYILIVIVFIFFYDIISAVIGVL